MYIFLDCYTYIFRKILGKIVRTLESVVKNLGKEFEELKPRRRIHSL